MAGKISKFSITKSKKTIIAPENAEKTVIKMCEHFDVDVDAIKDKKQRNSTENMLEGLVEFISRGLIEIDEKTFHIKQNLNKPIGQDNSVINIDYKQITGEQKLAMDGYEENEFYAKMYACLGAASGLGEHVIQKLSGVDLKAAETLTIFFL